MKRLEDSFYRDPLRSLRFWVENLPSVGERFPLKGKLLNLVIVC